MPNHVHVIVVPVGRGWLRRAFADAHRRYTGFINARERWTGHLWQGRFGSVAMDEAHLAAAARYVALNPVRARLAERGDGLAMVERRAHHAGEDDGLVEVAPVLEPYGDFEAFLGGAEDQHATRALRTAETTGRPAGNEQWLRELEERSGRTLAAKEAGPRAKDAGGGDSFVHLVNCHRNPNLSFSNPRNS